MYVLQNFLSFYHFQMLMCSFCKRTTKLPLTRKVAPVVEEESPAMTPRSKKRKKDKMCGLLIPNLDSSIGAASPVVKKHSSLQQAVTPRSSAPKKSLIQTPKRSQASPGNFKTSTPVASKVVKGNQKTKFNKDIVKKMMKREVKDNIRGFLMPMP